MLCVELRDYKVHTKCRYVISYVSAWLMFTRSRNSARRECFLLWNECEWNWDSSLEKISSIIGLYVVVVYRFLRFPFTCHHCSAVPAIFCMLFSVRYVYTNFLPRNTLPDIVAKLLIEIFSTRLFCKAHPFLELLRHCLVCRPRPSPPSLFVILTRGIFRKLYALHIFHSSFIEFCEPETLSHMRFKYIIIRNIIILLYDNNNNRKLWTQNIPDK